MFSRLFLLGLLLGADNNLRGAGPEVIIHPEACSGPIRNPLMGFIGPLNGRQPFSTLSLQYVRWSDIESSADDGVDKLRKYADTHWRGVEERGIKIIPRVFLELPKGSGITTYWPITSYWPADMPRDYQSAQFKERVARMVAKMGEAWDSDSRIAFVETGIIGAWGEQHHPSPDRAMQAFLGDAFQRAFKHKILMNRYPWQFTNYQFGFYWDSFGNPGWEMRRHVPALEGPFSKRWQIAPMGGEMSFASDPNIPVPRLAYTPTEAVAEHADTLVRYIRRWHWTALGWVSKYDTNNPAATTGAARVQAAFGYRYVIDEVRYPSQTTPGGELPVAFTVRNTGSAPMYYNWSVELSLLDTATREPVWTATFPDVDIRQWLPGNFSDIGKGRQTGDKTHTEFEWDTGEDYDVAPEGHKIKSTFRLPKDLPARKYILALAILDPAGNLPAIKLAIRNYFKGGRHPIGEIGVGVDNPAPELNPDIFDDASADRSLHYLVERDRAKSIHATN